VLFLILASVKHIAFDPLDLVLTAHQYAVSDEFSKWFDEHVKKLKKPEKQFGS
jgi:hypothetical protein